MPTNDLQPWGFYTGLPVQATFDHDGRTMHLLKELRYTEPTGREWIAPKDSVTDGASIPKVFWSIIGGPLEGKYREAAVLHDVACVRKTRPWREAARMFYTAMRCSGVNEIQAKIMYKAVYTFGPHWKPPTTARVLTADVKTSVPVTALMPPPPTEQEVERIKAWVEAENPSLEQIEAQSGAASPDLPD